MVLWRETWYIPDVKGHRGIEEGLILQRDAGNRIVKFRNDKIAVDGHLAQLEGDFSIEKLLLIPKFPKPKGIRKIQQAHFVQVADVVGGELPSVVDVKRADVELAALVTGQLFRIQVERHEKRPFIDRTLLDASADVGRHRPKIDEFKIDTVAGERAPQSAPIA